MFAVILWYKSSSRRQVIRNTVFIAFQRPELVCVFICSVTGGLSNYKGDLNSTPQFDPPLNSTSLSICCYDHHLVFQTSVSQPFLSCVPPEPICHTMSTPMLMILKKYNVTQVIIKCFHVPPAVCLRTPGWESLFQTML